MGRGGDDGRRWEGAEMTGGDGKGRTWLAEMGRGGHDWRRWEGADMTGGDGKGRT